MTTRILGLSAFYHDSAAVLLVDGDIAAAAQEERFSRVRHDHRFPHNALRYCLDEAGVEIADIDYVGFYDRPLTKFHRLLETHVAFAPRSLRTFLLALPPWLTGKLHLPDVLDRALDGAYHGRYAFADHHESHAASAFFPSPFDEAAILTLDGVGEWSTATLGEGRGNRVRLTHEMRFPHSLGLLYSAFTHYTGFKVNSGEYKVMGLAPYGEPRFAPLIFEHLMRLKEDGSFWLDMSYFSFAHDLTMTTPAFHALFGGPPRAAESELTQRDMDLAASVQHVTEEVMLRSARHLQRTTGARHLVMAGGVALNCVGNGRIVRELPFDDIWIQPAAGDAGGALGVASLLWHHALGHPRESTHNRQDRMHGALLGPSYTGADLYAALDRLGAHYRLQPDRDALLTEVAGLLAGEKVVGWFQGRMEFGPRALGARSILGDARSARMQQLMNLKIKFRESFRPFAPAVLREHAARYFELPDGVESPYMLLVAPVQAAERTPPRPSAAAQGEPNERDAGPPGLAAIHERRSTIPAATHVDYSARVQTVDRDRTPYFHALLERFYRETGSPVLLNTSFNIRGEPIVCTPEDAYRCFTGTQMDALVIGDAILLKEEQAMMSEEELLRYQAQFELD
ncbi:MAG: carbamoyltransferase [Pseudomonadota bacterium]